MANLQPSLFSQPDPSPAGGLDWARAAGQEPTLALAVAREGGQLVGLGLCAGEGRRGFVGLADLARLVQALDRTPAPLLVAHDAKALLHDLDRAGLALRGRWFDVMVAAHLCGVPLAQLTWPEICAAAPSGEARQPALSAAHAAPADAADVWRLAQALGPRLREQGAVRLFSETEMPLLQVLFEMERDGVAIDVPFLGALSAEIGLRMTGLERDIFAIAGHPFNVGSPQQLQRVLFEELHLPAGDLRRTRGGDISTSAWQLSDLRKAHPIVDLVLEHRELAKLRGTYTDALPAQLDPRDGRLHTTFNQVNTVTGRLSSSNPNLQNVPITSEMGRRVRKAFIAQPGGVVISADYSQVELRVLAHLASDPGLITSFERGEDIHARTAAQIYGIPLDAVGSEQRGHAKRINFGLAYGMGATSLASSTGMTLQQANEFIDRYFRGFPAVRGWLNQTKRFARANGYVETLLGRRRYFPDLQPGSRADDRHRARAEREAINTPVQGSAADVIKVGMIKLQSRLRAEGLATRMVLQVHDELVFDAPAAEAGHAQRVIREEMCAALRLRARLDVDVSAGPNWDDAK